MQNKFLQNIYGTKMVLHVCFENWRDFKNVLATMQYIIRIKYHNEDHWKNPSWKIYHTYLCATKKD